LVVTAFTLNQNAEFVNGNNVIRSPANTITVEVKGCADCNIGYSIDNMSEAAGSCLFTIDCIPDGTQHFICVFCGDKSSMAYFECGVTTYILIDLNTSKPCGAKKKKK
jgi:hypothetical protein